MNKQKISHECKSKVIFISRLRVHFTLPQRSVNKMPTEKDKYSLELCKRRGIKDKPHPIITDSMLLKAMAVRSRSNGYERLVQKNRDFFVTGPLMRCLDGDKYVDDERVSATTLFSLGDGSPF